RPDDTKVPHRDDSANAFVWTRSKRWATPVAVLSSQPAGMRAIRRALVMHAYMRAHNSDTPGPEQTVRRNPDDT
ncbi:MAG: hypothetical protein J4N99_06820, partial [Chloroflexi bacterium]|nr:hypothetical protein [Chloroflexota bacterium]